MLRPYEDPAWLEDQGKPYGMGEILTQAQMNEDPDAYQTTWSRPTIKAGGALDTSFSSYRMTPESPSVGESKHFQYSDYEIPYQKENPEETVELPDSTENPQDYMKGLLKLQTGFKLGERPQPPKMGQVMDKAIEEEGKQVMFDQSKVPVWYESDAFSSSLISFGLNLLAGNDIATAFNQAGGVFDKGYSREKRMAWAQDLADQGYDAHEIQSWIETGDHKALSDPMEKKMRMQSYRLGQAQLNKALYESSPEYQEYQRQMENYKMDMDERKLQAQIGYQNASLGLQAATLQLQQMKLNAKDNELTARDFTQLRSGVQTGLRTMEQKLVQSGLASRSLDDLQAAIKRGDNAAAQGAYQSFREYQARAMLGGNATLTPKAIEEVTGLPSKIDTVVNLGSLWGGGEPSGKWIAAQRANVSRALSNEHEVASELLSNAYRTLAPQYGHETAQKMIRRIGLGTNLGDMTFDPKTGYMIERNKQKNVASPLTVNITRN